MNAMKPTIRVHLTGKQSRQAMEYDWYRLLPSLRGVIGGMVIEFLSPWECSEPWQDEFFEAFVAWSREVCGVSPIVGCRRFPTHPSFYEGPEQARLEIGTRKWDIGEYLETFEHVENIRNEFGCDESWLSTEAHWPDGELCNLRTSDRDTLHEVVRAVRRLAAQKGVPLPTWARPGGAAGPDSALHNNWLTAGLGLFRVSDEWHHVKSKPEAHLPDDPYWAVPPVRMLVTYVAPRESKDFRALVFDDYLIMRERWVQIVEDCSTASRVLPERWLLAASVGNTAWLLRRLAEVG